MNKLSIEELKSLREAYYGMQYEKIVAVLDGLIAIRELKGDQVPVAWTSQRSLETKNKIVAFTDDMSALDYGTANGWTDIVELFTAPQKPVLDYFSSLVAMGKIAAEKAMRKYPQPNYVLLKVAEEAGEVVQAGVHYAEGRMTWAELEGEVIQLIAMLNRLMVEGDQINGIKPPQAIEAAGGWVCTSDERLMQDMSGIVKDGE